MAGDNPNFPTGTAVVNWFDSSHQLHIRVYSTDGYNVTERCNDGNGWTDGQFSAPGTHVSATCWMADNGSNIRVYCTFEDTTTEWCASPGNSTWTKGDYTTT